MFIPQLLWDKHQQFTWCLVSEVIRLFAVLLCLVFISFLSSLMGVYDLQVHKSIAADLFNSFSVSTSALDSLTLRPPVAYSSVFVRLFVVPLNHLCIIAFVCLPHIFPAHLFTSPHYVVPAQPICTLCC